MKNSTFVLLAALAAMAIGLVCLAGTMFLTRLTTTPAGQEVIVRSGAEACKTFDVKLGEWGGCSNLPESTPGITVDKKGYAHVYAGRVRVQFEYAGYPGIYVYRWFRPTDVKTR